MSSSDYQGVTSTYLALPFFALFGINVFALRLMTITVGLMGVVLTFFLARRWFGPGTARLSVLLIATSPAWVFWSRLGVYVVSQVMPIAAGFAPLPSPPGPPSARSASRNAPLYVGMFLLASASPPSFYSSGSSWPCPSPPSSSTAGASGRPAATGDASALGLLRVSIRIRALPSPPGPPPSSSTTSHQAARSTSSAAPSPLPAR